MDNFKLNERRRIGEEELARTIERNKMKPMEKSPSPVQKPAEELIEQYKKWNTGLKQQELQQQQIIDDINTINKPLARYKDDEEYNRIQREKEFLMDPLLKIKKPKKRKKVEKTEEFDMLTDSDSCEDKVEREKDEDNKSNIQAKQKFKYNGPQGQPNRFNILPGYRWDGVDRGNGFEQKIINEKTRVERFKMDAYKWSTEDM